MNMSGESFQYDPFGRRTAKTILSTTTNYLYDGANPVQELSGTTPTANMVTGGVDEYFTRTDSTGTANFLTNALGSTIQLTNSSGSTIASYTYEPFGNTTASGSSTNTYQYTGRENDGTGVYFYRARYYSPGLQRFVSEDPIRLHGRDVDFYIYAHQNPISLADPYGLWTFSLGGSFNFNYGFGSFQYSGGFVADSSGDFGVYNTIGGAGAFNTNGLGNFPNATNGYPYNNISPSGNTFAASLGLTLGVSNAKYICDLGGPFVNGEMGFGEGLRGSAGGFAGGSSHGTVVGGDVTLGGGAALGGGSGSVWATRTTITGLAGRYTNACAQ